jgi:short subunit fatty acids transporter
MFSTAQLVFALLFFIVFVVAMVISYRKDVKIHEIYYKGNFKVLIGFFAFIVLLFVIKIVLKR